MDGSSARAWITCWAITPRSTAATSRHSAEACARQWRAPLLDAGQRHPLPGRRGDSEIAMARSWPATSYTTSTPQRPTTSWRPGRSAAIRSQRRTPSAAFRTTLGYTYGKVFNTPSANIPAYNSAGNETFPDFSQASIFENPVGKYAVKKEAPQFGDTLTKVWGLHTIKIGGFTQTTDNYQSSFSYDEDGIMSFSAGQHPDLCRTADTPSYDRLAVQRGRAVRQRHVERLWREQRSAHRRCGPACRRRALLTTRGRRRAA